MTTPFGIIAKREFKRIAERKTLYLLSIIIPILVFAVYGTIYQQELIRELPISIVDNDHSPLSQKIIEMIEASPSMKIVKYSTSIEEIKRDFRNGTIHGAFYFPSTMEKAVKEGKYSSIVVYKNNSNLVIGNMITKESVTIIRMVSGGVLLKKLRSKGMNYDKSMNIINSIKIETNPLYNPNYSYANYLVPGLIAFTFQLLIMLGAVIVISSEFTHDTFDELVQLANGNILAIMLGKAIPHFIIHATTALMIIGMVFPFFNYKIEGSILLLIGFFFLFIAASLMLGLAISSFIHDQLFATEIAVFINTPAFIFSGFTFPLWAMPFIHSMFAQVLPFTHFLKGFLKIYQMNSPLEYILHEIGVLSLFVIISSIITLIALKHHVKHNSIKRNSLES